MFTFLQASKFNLDVPKDFSKDKKLKFAHQDSLNSDSEPGTRRQGSLNEKLNQINSSKHLSRLSE